METKGFIQLEIILTLVLLRPDIYGTFTTYNAEICLYKSWRLKGLFNLKSS